jgi:hypothetical protein
MTEQTPNPAPTAATATAAAPERQPNARERAEASLAAQRDIREANLEPASIGAAKATNLEGSGAYVEDGMKKAIPVDHPAVDNNPRAGTTVNMNRIDFNDPEQSEEEAVAEQLGS